MSTSTKWLIAAGVLLAGAGAYYAFAKRGAAPSGGADAPPRRNEDVPIQDPVPVIRPKAPRDHRAT